MEGWASAVHTVRRLLSPRRAIALGVLAFALNIAALVLVASEDKTAPQIVRLTALLPTLAVAMLVAVRRPGNPLGWLMLGCGVLFSLQAASVAYSVLDYSHHHGTLPLGRLAIALQPTWAGGLVLVAGILWLFPDGHLPAGRWRRVGGTLFTAGLLFGAAMFVPSIMAAAAGTVRVDADGTPASIEHPAGSVLGWVIVENIGFFALLISWVVWLAVQVPKYRRSSGERRLQLKWLYSGAAVFIVCLGFGLFQSNNATGLAAVVGAVLGVGIAALPLALGIGILKYRLYEIDRIISRTLAYAIVTGLLVGVYAGLVLLATHELPLNSGAAVAGSTLAAAALFNPLRKRVQRLVDRRFNRAQYDADATVAAFAGRLRESVDLASVQNELTAAVDQAFEPTHVSVWLANRAP
ncbi:MAG TPA: hypothetical protein VIY52_25160 [Streptosporangiaceae bacterium]